MEIENGNVYHTSTLLANFASKFDQGKLRGTFRKCLDEQPDFVSWTRLFTDSEIHEEVLLRRNVFRGELESAESPRSAPEDPYIGLDEPGVYVIRVTAPDNTTDSDHAFDLSDDSIVYVGMGSSIFDRLLAYRKAIYSEDVNIAHSGGNTFRWRRITHQEKSWNFSEADTDLLKTTYFSFYPIRIDDDKTLAIGLAKLLETNMLLNLYAIRGECPNEFPPEIGEPGSKHIIDGMDNRSF